MKKILALLLVLATALSCMLALTSCSCEHESFGAYESNDTDHWRVCDKCGHKDVTAHSFGDGERISNGVHMRTCSECHKQVYVYSTTETSEVFFESVDLGDSYTATVKARASVGDERVEIAIIRQGNVFCQESIRWKGNTPTHEAMFGEFTDTASYQYAVEFNSDGEVSSCQKSEMNQGTLAEFAEMFQDEIIPAELLDYSLYTYDAEDKVYKANNSAIGSYKNVELGFENRKLATISYKQIRYKQQDGIPYEVTYTYEIEIDYGFAELTIPAVTE